MVSVFLWLNDRKLNVDRHTNMKKYCTVHQYTHTHNIHTLHSVTIEIHQCTPEQYKVVKPTAKYIEVFMQVFMLELL